MLAFYNLLLIRCHCFRDNVSVQTNRRSFFTCGRCVNLFDCLCCKIMFRFFLVTRQLRFENRIMEVHCARQHDHISCNACTDQYGVSGLCLENDQIMLQRMLEGCSRKQQVMLLYASPKRPKEQIIVMKKGLRPLS